MIFHFRLLIQYTLYIGGSDDIYADKNGLLTSKWHTVEQNY